MRFVMQKSMYDESIFSKWMRFHTHKKTVHSPKTKRKNRRFYWMNSFTKLAAGRSFHLCLSQPNKFVIVVYITNMIFTLYRCDDWQISFLFDAECVCVAFLAFAPSAHWSRLASFGCSVSRFNEQKMIHCDCLSSIDSLFIMKSKPYVKRHKLAHTHDETQAATRCRTFIAAVMGVGRGTHANTAVST